MYAIRSGLTIASLLGVIPAAAACGKDSTGPAGKNASISFTVTSAAGTSTRAAAEPLSANSAATIVVQQVQIILAKVKLERTEETSDCDSKQTACDDVEARTVLVDLPVNGGVITPFTRPIPPGTYDKLELKVHKPEGDNSDDSAFRTQNVTWPKDASVRVRGTFDAGDGKGAQPFDAFVKTEAKIRQTFNPPLVVTASDTQAANVTVAVDVVGWFRNPDGSMIDPRLLSTNSNLAERVAQNIKNAFRSFKDRDRDGKEDRS